MSRIAIREDKGEEERKMEMQRNCTIAFRCTKVAWGGGVGSGTGKEWSGIVGKRRREEGGGGRGEMAARDETGRSRC